jgi:hypothetical protein
VGSHIVAAKGHDTDGLAGVVLSQRGQASFNMLYVRAVSADKQDQQRLLASIIVAESGAVVPSSSMVDSVSAMGKPPH